MEAFYVVFSPARDEVERSTKVRAGEPRGVTASRQLRSHGDELTRRT